MTAFDNQWIIQTLSLPLVSFYQSSVSEFSSILLWINDYVRFSATTADEHSSYDADAEYQRACYGTGADDEHH